MRQSLVLVASLTSACLLPAAAAAQTAPATADAALPAPQTAQPDVTAAAGTPEASADTDDVVVTAQRRSERLLDVPISVTALSAADLSAANITSTGDLGKITPGLTMDRAGPFSQPTIRGIGSSVTGPGIGTSVATYIDGFYQPSTVSNDFELADISSIQVLKGPQGTLFGRNSTGGAILVTTLDPTFEPSGIVRVNVGSYRDIRANAMLSTGITDTLAISGSVFYRYNRGYARDIVTGDYSQEGRSAIFRGKALWKPVDALKLTFAYSHGDIDDPWGVAQVAYRGVSAAAGLPGVVVPDNPFQTAANLPPQSRVLYNTYYLTGELDLGAVTLKSFTGWRDETDYVQLDSDKTAYPYQYIDFRPVDTTFTQEVTLSSNGGGPLQWVAGAYYYNDRSGYLDLGVTQGGPRFTFLNARLHSRAVAGFGDVTWQVVPHLFITGGLRYNHEDVSEEFDSILDGYTPHVYDKTFENLSPRAVVRYEIADRTNVYASYNQGYKAGTFNATGLSPDPVRPEKVDAYEVGLKTRMGSTRFEVAGFYYDYKDLQFVSYVGATAQLTNAAKARIYGVDASLTQSIGEHLSVALTGTYTDAKYQSFPGANHYNYLGAGVITNGPDDASGRPMVRTPKFAGRASIDYTTPLYDGTIDANVAFKYQSRVYFDPFGETTQAPYGLLDARIAWTDPSEKFTIAAYAQNLTDRHYYAVVTQQSESWPANYGAPQTFGGELTMKF